MLTNLLLTITTSTERRLTMELKQISTLISNFANTSAVVDSFREIELHSWGFDCGDVGLVITLNPETLTLTLQSDLGVAPPLDRLSVYTTLLGITGQSRHLRGIRMTLDSLDGSVIQECDISVKHLDLVAFKDLAEFFVNKAQLGKQLVQRSPEVAAPQQT